jgi:hypothetical protein
MEYFVERGGILYSPSGAYVAHHEGSLASNYLGGGLRDEVPLGKVMDFSRQYWHTAPPNEALPVRDWDTHRWKVWFAANGRRREDRGFDPFSPKPPATKRITSSDFTYEDQLKREQEIATRKKQEQLLAKATEIVLAGKYKNASEFNSMALFRDGSVRPIPRNIDTDVENTLNDDPIQCPISQIPGHDETLQCGVGRIPLSPQIIHGKIQDEYTRLSRESWTAMEKLHFTLDFVGAIPVVGIAADLMSAGIYALEQDTSNGLLSLAGTIPIVGDAAVIGKMGKQAVKNGEKIAVKMGESAGTTCSKTSLIVRADIGEGDRYARKVVEGGTGSSFAGHGEYRYGDGVTVIPANCTITLARNGIQI